MVYHRRRRTRYAGRRRRPRARRPVYKRRSYRKRGRRTSFKKRSFISVGWKANRGAQGARRSNPQRIGAMPYPAEKIVTFRYDCWDQCITNAAVDGIHVGTYRCASIFAPNKTLAGATPAYLHDTWGAQYANYEVLSSELKVSIYRGPKTDTGGQSGPIVLGIKRDEDDVSWRAPTYQWQRGMLDPTFYWKVKNIEDPTTGPLVMRSHFDKSEIRSPVELGAASSLRVAFGSSPTQTTPYWVVSLWPQMIGAIDEGAPGLPPINIHIEILYKARLSNRPDAAAYMPDGLIAD